MPASGPSSSVASPTRPDLHPENRFRGRYDLPALIRLEPALGPLVRPNPSGEPTLDFADPRAVKLLNGALLQEAYGIQAWEIPDGYLCPPIPGRLDMILHLADLLASDRDGWIPEGSGIRVLDIGVGANCIYPLLGFGEFGWHFLGSDTDSQALRSAGRILERNPRWAEAVTLRPQRPGKILAGLLEPSERFALSLCNPPFHASPTEAREGSERKWRNLGRSREGRPVLNFGGKGGELWCPGGETGFLTQMIEESVALGDRIGWFTSLVSKEATLPALRQALRRTEAREVRVIPMAQGQKRSRILAWSHQTREARIG